MGVAEVMSESVRPGNTLLEERVVFVIGNLGACGWDGMVCLVGVRCGGSDVGTKIRGSGWACVVWGGSDFVTPGLMGDGGVTGKIERGGGQSRFFMTTRTPFNGGVSNVIQG